MNFASLALVLVYSFNEAANESNTLIPNVVAFDYAKKFNNCVIGTTFFMLQMIEPLNIFIGEVDRYKTVSGKCGTSITPFWLDHVQNLLKPGNYLEEKSDPDIEYLCTRLIWSIVSLYGNCGHEIKSYDFHNYGYHAEIGEYLISFLDLGNEYTSVVLEDREIIAVANDDFSELLFKKNDLWYKFNGIDSIVLHEAPVRIENIECTIISKLKQP